MKKILIISPTPTHPQNAGNRLRVYQLAHKLKQLNYEVTFFYTGHEGELDLEAKKYWGDRLFQYQTKKGYAHRDFFSKKRKRLGRLVEDWKYTYLLDEWFDNDITVELKSLQEKQQFDVVISEYVFLSKALLAFDKQVIKVIDTHDKFSNRHKVYLENNMKPKWFSITEQAEKKAFNRADKIIAIQEEERTNFQKITTKPVEVVSALYGDSVELKKTINQEKLHLGFISSANPINVLEFNKFSASVLSKLDYEKVEVSVYGSICDKLEKSKLFNLCGRFDSAEEAYRDIDLVLNPVDFGTGYKMKVAEALHYLKPVITTAHSAKGFESYFEKGLLVARNEDDFLQKINQVAAQKELVNQMVDKIRVENQQQDEKFTKVLKSVIEGVC